MSAALIETLDISICPTGNPSSPAKAEARGCGDGREDGLTGKGVALPPEAAAEVARCEEDFARTFDPQDPLERELVHQVALGLWRSDELGRRIARHDARMNAARFANWEHEQRLAAVELGRRLGDDPERTVVRLRGGSIGCEWLIDRWTLLGHGLTTADEGGPGCLWTDADLALAIDLLGRPKELRHLDPRTRSLERLCAQARSGSEEGVAGLLNLIADEVAELRRRSKEVWEGVEAPQLEDWLSGLAIDLGPEGTKLRRYEAAADRMFRSALTRLERLKKQRGEPLIARRDREPAAPARPASKPVPAAPTPVRPEPAVSFPSLLDDPPSVLDLWIGGRPGTGIDTDIPPRPAGRPRPRGASGSRGANRVLVT